jgi:hypothetical protein
MANVIELIREDHLKVRQLFEQFKAEGITATQKDKITKKVCLELSKHARAEEATAYRLLKSDTLKHSIEEHREIDDYVMKLQENRDDPTELMQALEKSVIHHVSEEENGALLEVGRSGEDLEKLGQEFLNMKEVL